MIHFANENLFINAEGLTVRPTVLEKIRKNAQAVLRRYPKLLGMKIDLKVEHAKASYKNHVARIRLILPGYDEVVEKRGSQIPGLIGKTFEVANRQLRKKARELRAKRR